MTRPLPQIAPCPKGCLRCTLTERTNAHTGALIGYYVHCNCGWIGPFRSTKRGAILAWNRRGDAEAERRGAMAVVEWLRSNRYQSCMRRALQIEKAIERGEVLPAAKPEPLIVSRRGVQCSKPCVRGTRITVETIQRVAREWSSLKILEEYPSLTPEGLAAALAYRLPGKKARKR